MKNICINMLLLKEAKNRNQEKLGKNLNVSQS